MSEVYITTKGLFSSGWALLPHLKRNNHPSSPNKKTLSPYINLRYQHQKVFYLFIYLFIFLVGLLTEMDPLSNTSSTHEGTTRLLGLNRNRGQVIELRLRTDAYDGYRAYNTIRATLCHELAHNVHGPHDRQFWDLCHQIEREVAAASSGRSVGDGGGWEPSGAGEEDEDVDVPDHGGWTGGTFVLGGGGGGNGSGSGCSSGSGSGSGAGGSVSDAAAAGLSRRDVIAKAAEERMKRAREGGSAPPDDGATGGGGTT